MSKGRKTIKLFVKGKMGVGKTTLITTLHDILKRNKKFKESFNGYDIEIFEYAECDEGEIQSAHNKRWSIDDGKLEEIEFLSVTYHKSFIDLIWKIIKWPFVKLFKLIRK